jgi:hypothetical protein
MVWYACVMCIMHSLFVENPPIDLEAINPSFLRWFCHTWKKEDQLKVEFSDIFSNLSESRG